METKSLFVINKSGVIITPEGFDLLLAYTKHFIWEGRSKLDEYQRELTNCRRQDPEEVPQEDTVVTDMQREIQRAEAVFAELGQVAQYALRMYDLNFERLAEVFRKTRIQRGRAKVEDDLTLYAAVLNLMDMLKAESPKFRADKFIDYINHEDPSIITRQARRVSV